MKLKKCPMCGGKASLVTNGCLAFYVWCGDDATWTIGCGLKLHNPKGMQVNGISGWRTKQGAAKAWNKRTVVNADKK